MPQQTTQPQQNQGQAPSTDFSQLVLPKVADQKNINFQDPFYKARSIEVTPSDKELYSLVKTAQENGLEIVNLHGGRSNYRFAVQNKNGEQVGNFLVQLGSAEQMKNEIHTKLKNIVGDNLKPQNAADNLMDNAIKTEVNRKVDIGKENVILKTLQNIKQDSSHPIPIEFPRREMKSEVKDLINFKQDNGTLVATHESIDSAAAKPILDVAKVESNPNIVVFKESNNFRSTFIKEGEKDVYFIKNDQYVIADSKQNTPRAIVELTTVFSEDQSKVLGQSLVSVNSDGNSSVLVKTPSGEKFNLQIKEQAESLEINQHSTVSTVTSKSNFDKDRLIRMAK